MRRAGVLTAVVAVPAGCAAIVAGVFLGPLPTSSARAADRPFLIPEEIAWRVVRSCVGAMLDVPSALGPVGTAWGPEGSTVTFGIDTPESRAEALRIQTCLNQYDFDTASVGFNYIDAYERSQLWDYYTQVTVPCVAAHGVALDALERPDFFVPDKRPWNPYTEMDTLPVPDLLALYQACPPIPEYLLARHHT